MISSFPAHVIDPHQRLCRIATLPTPYRSLPGPPGPESRKSLQKVSRGPPAPETKKCPKQSRNSLRSLKTVYLRLRRLSRDCFGHFLDPGLGLVVKNRVEEILVGCCDSATLERLTNSALRVLSATLILSKNSRILDAKSRLKSPNLGQSRLKSA